MSTRREYPFPLRDGRYIVFEAVASGGMGVVHVARAHGDGGFARVVCVKALREAHRGDEDLGAKFRREAEITAHIASPHIVQVTDVVVDESGDIFLVMDLVVGTSLAVALRGAHAAGDPLTLPAVASAIVSAALLGVHAAHEARVVHRDLTPGNILVSEDGFVRVTDFGIAKILAESPRTGSIELYGKLQYMAPEQLRRAPIDRTVDVYAAGIVLWELLLGAPPFTTKHAPALMQEIMVGVTAPPSVHAPALPDALDAIVMRALATEPSARFATAQEMASALVAAVPPAPASAVAAWLSKYAAQPVAEMRARRSAALAWSASALAASPVSPRQDVAPVLATPVLTTLVATTRAPSPPVAALPPLRSLMLVGLGVLGAALIMLIATTLRRAPVTTDEPRAPIASTTAETRVPSAPVASASESPSTPVLPAPAPSASATTIAARPFPSPRDTAGAPGVRNARETCARYDPASKIVRYDPECLKKMGQKP